MIHFMFPTLLLVNRDRSSRQIVGRHSNRHQITQTYFHQLQPHPTRRVSQQPMSIRQLYPIQSVGKLFDHPTANFNALFSRHVNISGSVSVIKTVCSK
jgi:hypothetical protein